MTGVALALALAVAASAPCTKDADCKGARVCMDGTCAFPERGRGGGTLEALESRPGPPSDPDPGWAIPGSIVGFGGAALSLALAIGGEVTREEDVPGMPLRVASLVTVAAVGPITFVASGSARGTDPRVRGVMALRIIGWISYGVTLASGLGLFFMGEVTGDPPPALTVAGTGVLGAASLSLFAIDALVAGRQGARFRDVDAGVVSAPTLARWLAAVPGGAAVGVGGAF